MAFGCSTNLCHCCSCSLYRAGRAGCTLNGDVYANFSYSVRVSGGAATVTADQIIVTPFVVVPAASRFNFSAPWRVGQKQTQESVIRYTIVPPPGLTGPF